MVKPQYPYIDDDGISRNDKIKFYSNKNLQIKQEETGRIFDNAVDNYPSPYNYIEIDILIDDSLCTIEEKAKAYDIIMGVSE